MEMGKYDFMGESATLYRCSGMTFSIFELKTNSPCSHSQIYNSNHSQHTKSICKVSPLSLPWHPFHIFYLLGEYKKGQVEQARLFARAYNLLLFQNQVKLPCFKGLFFFLTKSQSNKYGRIIFLLDYDSTLKDTEKLTKVLVHIIFLPWFSCPQFVLFLVLTGLIPIFQGSDLTVEGGQTCPHQH